MSRKARTLLEQALKLPPAERLRLARRLEESVDEADDALELSPEWCEELDRRLDGILSGKTKGIAADEALAAVRRGLKERRTSE
jgi:putative addiction module component (TIGR02574 family)